ncbi:hypothetical protein OG778_23685 [Streptomyces sp. NBC_00184]|uniref:hypothetical protein n=1 Tax=Streptomyces sp. NBC_00184 TaxID=2975673 RepID=UPI002E2BA9FB|nr:hypothetical protein [Streptomyces sp. NBC_00184]
MSGRPVQTQDPGEGDDDSLRLLAALVCSALEPSLTGVLLFDCPPQHLASVREAFAQVLGRAAGHPSGLTVPQTVLDAATVDEDLWVRPRAHRGPGGIEFTFGPGPLAGTGKGPQVVVVPDLARLSVPGMRAAVQLLGADTATLEHSGIRNRWRPHARWLACCRSEDAELIPPHLLDRFPVRLAVPGLQPRPGPDPLGSLPPEWSAALDPATPRTRVTLTDSFAPAVLQHLEDHESDGHRRALALARIARALARLDGGAPLGGPLRGTAAHVGRAARLIRLRTVDRSEPPPEGSPEPQVGARPDTAPDPLRPGSVRPSGGGTEPGIPVHDPQSEVPLGLGPVTEGRPATGNPYPEDNAGPGPDRAALRAPARRTAGARAARGPVVGVRRARDLWDLAPSRTAMEAAKYRAHRGGSGPLQIYPQDLRGYVRAPEPVRVLTLLLDHTCRGDWDWSATLEPFLHWAYVTRASVQVVEVGGEGEANELRAGAFTARSTRDPRIAAALARGPGRATPLADGLDRAGHALRRAFRHHRAGPVEALLVVVTDGRGNVPLAVSRSGVPSRGPVQRAGVDDALAVAGRIRALGRSRLHSVVVDPGRHPYTRLPAMLAEALGCGVVAGRTAPAGRNPWTASQGAKRG